MLTDTLIRLFTRDLNQLKTEIGLYKEERNLWVLKKEISNTGGNLSLHIVGNLNHFIGAQLGNTNYIRQRSLEFSLKEVPKKEILLQIDETLGIVKNTLKAVSSENLKKNYPIEVFGHPMSTEYFLVHLSTHLTYHLGQINYHRRLLDY